MDIIREGSTRLQQLRTRCSVTKFAGRPRCSLVKFLALPLRSLLGRTRCPILKFPGRPRFSPPQVLAGSGCSSVMYLAQPQCSLVIFPGRPRCSGVAEFVECRRIHVEYSRRTFCTKFSPNFPDFSIIFSSRLS